MLLKINSKKFLIKLLARQIISPSYVYLVTAASVESSNKNTHELPKQNANRKQLLKLGFIGAGKIAQSIILGLIKQQIVRPQDIYASDVDKSYLSYLREKCPRFQVRRKS
jgi:beta-lactamase regulating signal transducer with metallopeptidase domain